VAMFSATVRCGNRPLSWMHSDPPAAADAAARSWCSMPLMTTGRSSGSTKRLIMRKSVDLPDRVADDHGD